MRKLFQYPCILLLIIFLTTCSKEDHSLCKEVVLTFDDAPNFPENTSKMLDVLKKHQVKATFFCIGQYLRDETELASRIAREQLLGNHTYSHIAIEDHNMIEIFREEIHNTQSLIDSLQPSNKRYFRPPYSKLTLSQKITLVNNGYDVVMWDLSAEEWNGKVTTKDILDYYHRKLDSRADIPIILFHLSNTAIEALDVLLAEFTEKGIRVITLDDYRSRKKLKHGN